MGGVSALDYLVKVRGMGFVEAVQQLCDCLRFEPPVKVYMPKPQKKPPFILPKPFKNNDRVIDYLSRRGVGMALLQFCINTGRLYEDERHNCVFVGFDTQGVPRYAMLRSSDPASTFLREVEGSDKAYSFNLPPQERSQTLHLFESAIDCLSFVELQRMDSADWKPDNYLSLSGVYQPRKELAETPLPISLMQFLPGQYTTELLPPDVGKDYNEQLMNRKNIIMNIKTRGAKSAPHHSTEEMAR